ncbi:MAG: M3 family oligoendopeptidase [Candidatus Thorarchaeota archaeon]|nr:MAG: M3 family oligoendopeptidase [Candidatus Thorarchaeota archaeon]
MIVEQMRWDLSQLVEIDDPDYISERLTAAVRASEEFRDKHRGKVPDFNAKQVLEMLEESDKWALEFEGPFMYAYLKYFADMTTDVAKRLHSNAQNATMLSQQNLAFMELELGQLLKKNPEIINDPVLSEYKHKLERLKRQIPYMLSEEQEQLAIQKDKNGIDAWSQIQSDWLATREFEIEVDGETKTMPYGEIIGLYEHPNRDLRKRAHEVVYSKLGEDEILWASAVRSVSSDHNDMTKLRKWPTPMTQSLIANDVDEAAIQALMNTIEKNVGVFQKYLRLKAKAMGLEKLGNWDEIAPLPSAPDKKYSWDEARKMVVESYTEFDEESGTWMDEMFEQRHLDGEVRKGKTSGAFCSTWFVGKSAYILQSYNGILGDVFTMAHELGHALHAYLGTRAQKPSNYEIGSCIAETGSIFGTLLLVEKLLTTGETKEEKLAVLSTVLDDFGQAAFQVSARVFFETAMYEAIEKNIFLSGEKISELWVEARDKVYGDAIDWLPVMKWWWTMKLHFYIPNYRYYNYPYVYAQLFVYAMYRLYKEQGKVFVPNLKALLAAGSSKSPRELAAEIGFDITTEEFWQKGIDQFDVFIKEFEDTL